MHLKPAIKKSLPWQQPNDQHHRPLSFQKLSARGSITKIESVYILLGGNSTVWEQPQKTVHWDLSHVKENVLQLNCGPSQAVLYSQLIGLSTLVCLHLLEVAFLGFRQESLTTLPETDGTKDGAFYICSRTEFYPSCDGAIMLPDVGGTHPAPSGLHRVLTLNFKVCLSTLN